MDQQLLSGLYERAVTSLIKEIESYESDDAMWVKMAGISNSGGNLCLHLLGNLHHFIGATLGNTGYVRNREAEFSLDGISREELVKQLHGAKQMVNHVLMRLSDDDLNRIYPFDFVGQGSVESYMVFFLGHFQYHLGQINYHRRLTA